MEHDKVLLDLWVPRLRDAQRERKRPGHLLLFLTLLQRWWPRRFKDRARYAQRVLQLSSGLHHTRLPLRRDAAHWVADERLRGPDQLVWFKLQQQRAEYLEHLRCAFR
ncbi:hypothetical protein F6B41_33040 [Microbacterium lushaniae]|nr:hypothetical protein F6B41_33040 [Microbacterium lushaniae]